MSRTAGVSRANQSTGRRAQRTELRARRAELRKDSPQRRKERKVIFSAANRKGSEDKARLCFVIPLKPTAGLSGAPNVLSNNVIDAVTCAGAARYPILRRGL